MHLAVDGLDGLHALSESHPDVIISDLKMPNMDGFEFLSVVRTRFPHIAVIAISAEFSLPQVRLNVFADAFFEKGDYTMENLFRRIIILLGNEQIRPFAKRPRRRALRPPLDEAATFMSVNCASCLRDFPLTLPCASGFHEAKCDSCQMIASFEIKTDAALERPQRFFQMGTKKQPNPLM